MSETNIFGVLFSGALISGALALVGLTILRRIALRFGLYRLVWHPHLADVALFTILWALISAVMPGPGDTGGFR